MERLYYNDAYLREFQARITGTADEGRTIYLDRTAFYPASGGQPHDLGTLAGVAVLDVVDEGERIAHRLARPVAATEAEVTGVVDGARRLDHMQQHTGQHLLSAVLAERFGMPTVSFHMGDHVSTIDVQPKGLTPERLVEVERLANEEILANRAVAVTYAAAEDVAGLRKESQREGTLRIVSIEGLDRSACGGTHVRWTGEIGLLLLGKTEKVRDTIRIEFVCGGRALRRARRDYDALSRMARLFSTAIEEVPAAAEALQERAAEADKQNRRMSGELAAIRGRELYRQTEPEGGLRFARRSFETLGEEARGEAQGFTAMGEGVYVATGTLAPALMLACSPGGANAGAILKQVLAAVGGRGGGQATMAQGSLPAEAMEQAVAEVRRLVLSRE